MGKQFTVEIGDKVAYSAQFLRSTGMAHTPAAHARGVVTEIKPLGSITLATIAWDNPDIPERVAVPNLAKVGANPRFAQC